MSLEQNIEFVNSVHSQLRVLENKKPVYELPKGVKAVDYRNLASQNGNSTQGTQYTIFLNNNQILSDYMVEEISFTVTLGITSTAGATNNPFTTGNLSPRALPIESATQTAQLTINGTPINVNSQNMLAAILAFNKKPEYSGRDLPCCMIDAFTDLAVPTNPVVYETQSGSLKNPLLDYFSSTYGCDPRFTDVQVTALNNSPCQVAPNNVNQQRAFTFTVRQPIFTGVTSMTLANSSGFLGATVVQFNRTFTSNLAARLINYVPLANNTLASLSATVNSARILYTVYTPDDSYVVNFPSYYPVIDYGVQSSVLDKTVDGIARGATVNFVSQTLSLSVLPRCIYVWVALANSSPEKSAISGCSLSDAPGYQIQKVNVTFNGVGGQFSGMQPYQIYETFMARQGFNKSFLETGAVSPITQNPNGINAPIGLYGSVLRIDVADLQGIPWDRVSIGSAYNCNFSVQVSAINLSANATNPTLFVQVCNDAMLAINSPTTSQLYKGILDEASIMSIRKNAPYEFTHTPMIGGNFFNKLWDGVKQGANWAWDHKGDILNTAKSALPLVGLGRRHRKRSHKAGALISKRKMHRRMRGGQLDSDSDYSDSDQE